MKAYNNILLLIILVSVSCDPADVRLRFINTNNQIVYADLEEEDSLNVKKWAESIKKLYYGPERRFNLSESVVEPGDTIAFTVIGNWEGILSDTSDRVSFYVTDTVSLTNYFMSGDVNDLNVKTRRLNILDIKRQNWIISYPE